MRSHLTIAWSLAAALVLVAFTYRVGGRPPFGVTDAC